MSSVVFAILHELLENEVRSCSMSIGDITPLFD